jgi:hypothetical protein
MPAKSPFCLWQHSRLFAVVRVRWCTIGVHEPHRPAGASLGEPQHIVQGQVQGWRHGVPAEYVLVPRGGEGAEKVWPHKGSRTPSKEPSTCATERLGLRWCQGVPGIPWTFWQPGPASAQSPEPAYRQLGLRGVFRDPAGPQHGEGGRTADGREGGYRGPRHPKILSMMTAGARDENAPWGGWRRKE